MINIVILGGNFAGVSTAHYLLRHVLPSLNSLYHRPEYKVTLVSASTHTYYNVSAPRALISETVLSPSRMFGSIEDAFSGYDSTVFVFVHGEAVAIDEISKSVLIKSKDEKSASVNFDSLIIATGSTGKSQLWKIHNGDHEATIAAFKDMHARLSHARSILIVGGGTVAVETTGEIASHFEGKHLTIVTNGHGLLMNLKHRGVAIAAEARLRALGVEIIFGTKFASSREVDGGTEVEFNDETKRILDVVIDCTGDSPSTAFVPASWLNERKRVETDGTTLRATQAPKGVYSIGDAASYSRGSAVDATWAVSALGYSIWHDLRKEGMPLLKEKKYKQIESETQIIPIGPKGGVGILFGWKIPSFAVWLLKAKTMTIEKAVGLATGGDFLKA